MLVDGLRPDRLRACEGQAARDLYLDQLLRSGLLFAKMFTGNGCSKTSLHAAFTSMYGVNNGVRGYTLENLEHLDPWVLTLPDHLRRLGFRTFRYCDKNDLECHATPKSGFDVWEDSGFHRLAATPGGSFELPVRERFVDRFNQQAGRKFAFFHLLSLHDVCGDKETYHWTSGTYEAAIAQQSEEVQRLVRALDINEQTLLVISTDHGIMLDAHRLQTTREAGVRLDDGHLRVFSGWIGKGLVPRVVTQLTRAIDIAPTLLEAVGGPPMGAQGVSLWRAAAGHPLPELDVLMTRDSVYEDPPWPDSPCTFGVRTRRWKYVTHRWRPESTWLMDLERDGDYRVNLAGKGLPIERELRERVFRELIVAPEPPLVIYHRNGAPFSRADLRPVIRVIVPVTAQATGAEATIRSLLDQVGPYREVLVLDGSGSDPVFKSLQESFWPHPHLTHQRTPPAYLGREVLAAVANATTPFVALVTAGFRYPADFLHRLHRQLLEAPERSLASASPDATTPAAAGPQPLGWLLRRGAPVPVTAPGANGTESRRDVMPVVAATAACRS